MRWKAIDGEPLKDFFKGVNNETMTPLEANLSIAEDQIMTFSLFIRAGKKYRLRYIPGAMALTDPRVDLISLMKQRRRWNNGGLMASFRIVSRLYKIKDTKHSCCMKFGMLIF